MGQREMTWRAALAEAGCHGFLEPVAARAVERALVLCPEAAPYVSGGAKEQMRGICLSRLATIYERPLIQLAVRRAGFCESLALNAGGGERAETMRRLAKGAADTVARDGEAFLREKLAFAPAYEKAIADNFADAMAELLARFLPRRADISRRLLEGRPITCIEGFSAAGADPHRHGRMVVRVDSDAGSFFYKPHDCRLDALFCELVGAWFPDCARVPALVQGDGFAFVEQLVPEELADEEGLRVYWRNLGRLTALFCGLGSRDMTCDNIMCCGTRPAVLDIETLLVGEMRFLGEALAKEAAVRDMPAKVLADSVVCTAILPLSEDGMPVSPLVADNASGTCLPRIGGVPCAVRGFEGAFADGFSEGYRRLMRCRETVLEMLGRYRGAACRQILINTQGYAKARSLLFSPQAMADAARRDAVLAELNEKYGVFSEELRQEAAASDAGALLEGDIPYYWSRACSRELFAGDGRSLGELLARSALEVASARLARFSEETLGFELGLIRRCLGAGAGCSIGEMP